jgi:hypothetical protein
MFAAIDSLHFSLDAMRGSGRGRVSTREFATDIEERMGNEDKVKHKSMVCVWWRRRFMLKRRHSRGLGRLIAGD